MWVQRLKSGRYKYNERYVTEDGQRHHVSVTLDGNSTRDRKIAAQELHRRIIEQQRQFTHGEKLRTEVHTAANLFRQHFIDTHKVTSVITTRVPHQLLMEHFGTWDIEDINQQEFKNKIDKLLRGKSQNTQNSYLSYIRSFIRYAFENGYLSADDMARKLKTDKKAKRADIELKYLEKDELQDVLQQIRNNSRPYASTLADMLELCALVGLRYGECCALCVDDVDINEHSIHVQRTYSHIARQNTLPKRDRVRYSYFNDKAREILTNNLKCAKTLVFASDGHIINIAMANAVLKSVKIPSGKKITTHIFRHTFVTNAVQHGVPLMDIARQVGHADEKMIRTIYMHFNREMQEITKKNILSF